VSPETERAGLCEFLDMLREALIDKLRGLSEEDARRAATVSSLSLLSLIKHSAIWERRWFQVIVAGRSFPGEWPEVRSEEQDSTFRLTDEDTVDVLSPITGSRSAPRKGLSAALISIRRARGRRWHTGTCGGLRSNEVVRASPDEGDQAFVRGRIRAVALAEVLRQGPLLHADAEHKPARRGDGEAHERPPVPDENAHRHHD
jgi:hypothetical protein